MAENRDDQRNVSLVDASIETLFWFFVRAFVALLLLSVAVGLIAAVILAVIAVIGSPHH